MDFRGYGMLMLIWFLIDQARLLIEFYLRLSCQSRGRLEMRLRPWVCMLIRERCH